MSDGPQSALNRVWYGPVGLVSHLLLPLSWLYGAYAATRRAAYRSGLLKSFRPSVPTVVVGNLTVGGAGKTPVVIWLVSKLRQRGFAPGVVSRGYGAQVTGEPRLVGEHSTAVEVGDEPLLIRRSTSCPVVVHPDRVAAADMLIQQHGVDVIVADDGMQHYRLRRDVELAVVDGARGHGNGRLLPAGPLREPNARLQSVDRLLINGKGVPSALDPAAFETTLFQLRPVGLFHLDGKPGSMDELRKGTVNAVAGIGNPERFFMTLESLGFEIERHPLIDHAGLPNDHAVFEDDRPIIMTEKDAVKWSASRVRAYFLRVEVDMSDESWLDSLAHRLREVQR